MKPPLNQHNPLGTNPERIFLCCNFLAGFPYSSMVNLSDRKFEGIGTQLRQLSWLAFHCAGTPIIPVLQYNTHTGK